MHQRPKRKSDMRWEQGRHLYANVCPSLPTPSHAAVLMFCWFQANGKECRFSVAHIQVAKAVGLSYERARKIINDMETAGVIRTTKESVGRGYAPERVITGKNYPKKVVTDDHPKTKKVVTHDRKGGHP